MLRYYLKTKDVDHMFLNCDYVGKLWDGVLH